MANRTLRKDISRITTALGQHKEAIGKGIVAVGAVVAIGGLAIHHEKETDRGIETVALREATSAQDGSFILKPGARIRTSPRIHDVEIGHNLVSTVPSGEIKVVRNAIVGPNGWVGFSLGADPSSIKSLEDRAEDTVWVALDQLTGTGHAVQTPYQSLSGNPTQPIHIGENGAITGPGQEPLSDIGQARSFQEDGAAILDFVMRGQ